jgi:hypothetical protein
MKKTASVETKQEEQQPIDSLVYNTFADSFNREYSTLNENQKDLLNNYISSFVDNGLELKVYLNEEIGKLKNQLNDIKIKQKQNDSLVEKVQQVYNILENTKETQIDTETIEIVLNTQQLVKEILSNDS